MHYTRCITPKYKRTLITQDVDNEIKNHTRRLVMDWQQRVKCNALNCSTQNEKQIGKD